jgi:hypothetical protein
MGSALNNANATRHQWFLQAPPLGMPAMVLTAESLHWAQTAQVRSAATRRERTAVVAYLMWEARGFGPGRDADDWLRAQKEVDAEEAGISQL